MHTRYIYELNYFSVLIRIGSTFTGQKKYEMVPHFLTCDQGSNTPPNQTLVINSGFNFLTIFYILFFSKFHKKKIPCPQKKTFIPEHHA